MSFETIIGQEKAVDILRNQLKSGRIPHSYIFVGPEGTGRKKTALELAKALNCPEGMAPCNACVSCRKIDRMIHPDVRVIDYEWQSKALDEELPKSGKNVIKIDTIRLIQKEISLKPFEGKYRIFIIDPAETLNKEAANCLLKTLEEPSSNSLIILITGTLETLPKTIISRCQQVRFRMLPEKFICGELNKRYGLDGELAERIAKVSCGSLGRAISLKDSQDSPFGINAVLELWGRLVEDETDTVELIEFSNRLGRRRENVEDFIYNLLIVARNELVARTCAKYRKAVELILSCRGSLRYNVNMNMLVGFMLLELKEIFHAGSG